MGLLAGQRRAAAAMRSLRPVRGRGWLLAAQRQAPAALQRHSPARLPRPSACACAFPLVALLAALLCLQLAPLEPPPSPRPASLRSPACEPRHPDTEGSQAISATPTEPSARGLHPWDYTSVLLLTSSVQRGPAPRARPCNVRAATAAIHIIFEAGLPTQLLLAQTYRGVVQFTGQSLQPLGPSASASLVTHGPAMAPRPTLNINIISDTVCPWCYVGASASLLQR